MLKGAEFMENRSFNLLEIIKAQISNKNAENCKNMKIRTMVIILIALVFISAFPYVNQRVGAGLRNSDASQYPGLGSVLINAAKKSGGFYVENNELVFPNGDQVFEEGQWKVVFTQVDAEMYLSNHPELSSVSSIIFSKKSLLINCPETQKQINSVYTAFPDFSSEQILQAAKKTDTMVVYIQALLFSMCTAQVPSAILMMVLLMAVQTVLFIFAMAFLLSHSKRNGWDKKDTSRKFGFLSCIKIMTSVAIFPCVFVSGISYFNPSFGLSLGWILYSFILGLRAITIYITRVRGKDTRQVV